MRENQKINEAESALDAASLAKIKVMRPKDAASASPKKVKSGDITDRLQALADELEATKPDVPSAAPVFEAEATDIFETTKAKKTDGGTDALLHPRPSEEKPKPATPETAKTPAPAEPKPVLKATSQRLEETAKEVVAQKKPKAKTRKVPQQPQTTSAVPPRRANWARPAASPGWQKKTVTPDMLTYWMELRNGNRYPTWQSLDTQKIGKYWPNCVLVHCDRTVGRLNLETSFSQELRQAARRANPLRDFSSDIDFTPMVVDWVLSLARDVANTAKPAHGTEYFPSMFDEIPLRVIALPLSEDQVEIDHVLCYVQKL
jgi:hypothetical protein